MAQDFLVLAEISMEMAFCDSVYNLATDNTDYKNSLLAYSLLFSLYGLFYSMKDVIGRAYISENVGRSGKAYGIYHFGI